MINVPYVKQPDPSSCALTCYTMVAKYFFPEVTLDQIAEISDWERGYVVWAFKFWFWLMGKGILVTEHDTIDYQAWVKYGVDGLKKSISEKDFNFYLENTRNLDSYREDIAKILRHPNFNFVQEKPNFSLLEESASGGKVCEVVLDSRTLRKREGFSLHRVVIVNMDKNSVSFHDPAYSANNNVEKKLFERSWLESVSDPELCIYSRKLK